MSNEATSSNIHTSTSLTPRLSRTNVLRLHGAHAPVPVPRQVSEESKDPEIAALRKLLEKKQQEKEKQDALAAASLPKVSSARPDADGKAVERNKSPARRIRRATPPPTTPTDPIEYFRLLDQVGVKMGEHKYRDENRVRNTW